MQVSDTACSRTRETQEIHQYLLNPHSILTWVSSLGVMHGQLGQAAEAASSHKLQIVVQPCCTEAGSSWRCTAH